MSNYTIKLKNADGEYLYPQTVASVVYNNNSEALGGVEADAQVNVIEAITVDGEAVTITDKTAAITLPEYSIAKAAEAEDGYASSYQLTKNGTAVGDLINIPKDLVVESGSVKTVTEADSPVEGYAVGDKYIDLVLANSDDQHIYILVSDLVDTYTAGTGITITDNEISVDKDALGIQDSITGAASTIVSEDLTASMALVSDENGKVAASTITTTELGYLGGVTSNVQTQIDTLAAGTVYYEVLSTSDVSE